MLGDEPLVEEPASLSQGSGQRRRVLPDIVSGVEVRRAGRIKARPGAGISLHLQHVPVCLNCIALFDATGVGVQSQHRRADRLDHKRDLRRQLPRKPVRSAGGRARQALPSTPPTRREKPITPTRWARTWGAARR
jgi:hypothetical protein